MDFSVEMFDTVICISFSSRWCVDFLSYVVLTASIECTTCSFSILLCLILGKEFWLFHPGCKLFEALSHCFFDGILDYSDIIEDLVQLLSFSEFWIKDWLHN